MNLLNWNPLWSETEWDTDLIRRFHEIDFDLIVTGQMTALENLALDAALLYSVAAGKRKAVVRFWDWSEAAVILGSYQSVMNELDKECAQSLGFTIARRISGGGAMVVEPGKTITYSIVVPDTFLEGLSFVQSFSFLDHWCVQALRSMGVPAMYKPINDIASAHGKIGGAAQCRRKKTVLHHTAMAYDLDNDLMRRLLRHGQKKMTDKGIASAEKVVSPLRMFTDVSHDQINGRLREAFADLFPTTPASFTADELSDADARRRVLASEEWLYRVK
jgi:lipoate---protein ligase